jgi:ATP-dependent Clp protease ATP-binding subunit ClpC
VPFTPQAKRVLELSIEEARQLGHNYIGTEHLLLGLMKEGQSIAAKILESLGARLDEVRQETLALLGDQYYPRPKKRSQTPVLDEFARDLTQFAREGKLDPVIGREMEIERVIQILSRRTKNNPVLIGEPWARPPSWRGWPRRSSITTCPTCWSASACSSSTSAPWSPAPSIAASSRSA